MTNMPSAQDKIFATRARNEIRAWLSDKHFTHFVTLAFNEPMVGKERMRQKLKAWDARVNRRLLGKRWRKKTDERLNWLAIPEKQESNPHWHLLVQILPEQFSEFEEREFLFGFDAILETTWRMIVPSGTVDVQPVENKRVQSYITKQLNLPQNYEDFVVYREFFEL